MAAGSDQGSAIVGVPEYEAVVRKRTVLVARGWAGEDMVAKETSWLRRSGRYS